jgi:pimeloyl-ACP methyl ester carboxylesterase
VSIAKRVPLDTGLTYNVLDWDGPGDLTFVLVHGFSDLAFSWTPVAERLAAHGHVIAPDLRGHGDSDWIGPGGYYHFFDYLADLDSVIRALARPRVVLVGHSMGGSICGYYAGMRPDRLAGLVLLEGLGPPDQSEAVLPTRTASWIEAWGAARTKQRVMPTIDEAIARLRKHDHLLDAHYARTLAVAGTRAVPGGFTWKHDPLHMTMGPYPYRLDVAMQFWRRVICPTLLVDGADSRLNLPLAERARRREAFLNHRHIVVGGAGHAVQRHQPAEVARLVLELVGITPAA